MPDPAATERTIRIYDDEGDALIEADRRSNRVILLPSGDVMAAPTDRDRIRIQWGQHLLADLMADRYRTVICGVNDVDNSRGILGELLELVTTSQWTTDWIKIRSRNPAYNPPVLDYGCVVEIRDRHLLNDIVLASIGRKPHRLPHRSLELSVRL